MNRFTYGETLSKNRESLITGSYAVELQDVYKQYGTVRALNGMTLAIPQGTICGLLGPNGAGKTTVIKTIVGIMKPTQGYIRVAGLDPVHQSQEVRSCVGYMPQYPALYEDLTPYENVLFFASLQGMRDKKRRAREVLDLVELTARSQVAVKTLSGGMKKRVSLACALVHNPSILFLDEPTAAIDPELKRRTWQLFDYLISQGVTIVVSTHLMDEALLCNSLAIMRQGKVIALGEPRTLLQQGSASIHVSMGTETITQLITNHPQDLARALGEYGLTAQVSAIDFQPDSLESIILNIIRKEGA